MSAVLSSEIESRRTEIVGICARLGVRRLELFGSGTRSGAPRDLDYLLDLVDLVTPPGLANPYFRQRVEQEKTLLYAA
jgi:predicted nucleotidyltransferase